MSNWVLFDNFRLNQLGADRIDFRASGDTLRVMLTNVSYTPNQASHAYKTSVTNEVTGTNYTARGPALSAKTLTLAAGTVTFDANDITFSQHASGFNNARIAVLYKDTGTDATSALIAYADFGSARGNVDGDLVLVFDAAGIMTSP